jgi:hypothetical protein
MIQYLDTFKDRFGVEAICRTLGATESPAGIERRRPDRRQLGRYAMNSWCGDHPIAGGKLRRLRGSQNACPDAQTGVGDRSEPDRKDPASREIVGV